MSELLGFTADQVCQLTGLTMRQLRYWDNMGFFRPRLGDEQRRRPYSRVYAFRDVVGLRAIATLRNKHRIPLQELRRVGSWLAERDESPWASLRLYLADRRVFFDDPATGVRIATRPAGQASFPFFMEAVVREVEQAVHKLRKRPNDDIGGVVRHRYVAHNAPVLAGTRIPTSAIWRFHQAGYAIDAILEEYPRLSAKDVRAAIAQEEQRRQKRAG